MRDVCPALAAGRYPAVLFLRYYSLNYNCNRGYACKKRKPAFGAQDSRASLESYCYRAIPVTLVLGPAGAASERMQVRETEIIQ